MVRRAHHGSLPRAAAALVLLTAAAMAAAAGRALQAAALGVCADVRFAGRATLAAGNGFTCALSVVGGVACWGRSNADQLAVPSAVAAGGQVAVVAGGNHACALSAAGGVSCWGDNSYRQTAAMGGQVAVAVGRHQLAPCRRRAG